MSERKAHPAEVIVRIISAAGDDAADAAAEAQQKQHPCSYHALIYAPPELLPAAADLTVPEDQPRAIQNVPLARRETVVVDWDYYKAYLRAFLCGEKAAVKDLVREKIFCSVSDGLAALLSGELIAQRPLRVWWSLVNPKLIELPWELLAYTTAGYADSQISLVRGLPPPGPVPRIPVGKQLRLAFIHEPDSTSAAFTAAFKDLPQLSVDDITDPPLEALQRALQDGYELIHLVADGAVSLAYEGYLYLRRPSRLDISAGYADARSRRIMRLGLSFYKLLEGKLPARVSEWVNKKLFQNLAIDKLTPAELSAMQRGRPLSILCLSPPKSSDHDPHKINGLLLPSIFRAFACLGNTALPMPNIVAQIGPSDEEQMERFWHHFYRELAASLEIEAAMNAGLKASTPQPFALFLRQQNRSTFQRNEAGENVTQINAELKESRDTVEQLLALGGHSEAVAELVAKYQAQETARQQHLEAKLLPYVKEEE